MSARLIYLFKLCSFTGLTQLCYTVISKMEGYFTHHKQAMARSSSHYSPILFPLLVPCTGKTL